MEMRIVITDQHMKQLQLLLASLRKSWKDQHHLPPRTGIGPRAHRCRRLDSE
jgi:hypothetical protein